MDTDAMHEDLPLGVIDLLLQQLRPIDRCLGLRLYRGSVLAPLPEPDELALPAARSFWLAALIHYAQAHGHSGLSLQPTVRLSNIFREGGIPAAADLCLADLFAELGELRDFKGARCVAMDGAGQEAPCRFDPRTHILYFQSNYQRELELAQAWVQRSRSYTIQANPDLKMLWGHCFPVATLDQNPWQSVACFSALRESLCIITGGPGTGKTRTIARWICLLQCLADAARPRRIHLLAPTGKAAMRLQESLQVQSAQLLGSLPEVWRTRMEAKLTESLHAATTVHQFIGRQTDGRVRHHAGNPVESDCIVVDEASMLDLELSWALFQALPAHCRVVLLGDQNQLCAVESGKVFADLLAASGGASGASQQFTAGWRQAYSEVTGLSHAVVGLSEAIAGDRVVELTHSYRFTAQSEVGELARCLVQTQALPHESSAVMQTDVDEWLPQLRQLWQPYAQALAADVAVEDLLAAFNHCRILCAQRTGLYGSERINAILARELVADVSNCSEPVHGLPFMIRRNQAKLDLWNGDCGIFYYNAQQQSLQAYLPGPDGLRCLNISTLTDWEPAFAMTIHKSQGSEFEHVGVLLPTAAVNFVSWEMVYTAVTRAKKSIQLLLSPELLGQRLPRTQRDSGLAQRIQELQADTLS
jgi:exodeoxyribonuclease V alpha subunit